MSRIRIHQGNKELAVDVKTSSCRYIDLRFRNDMTAQLCVPIGTSRRMVEQYIRLNQKEIFEEYDRRLSKNHQTLPVTLELEDGRMQYRSGLRLPFLGQMDTILRIRYQPDLSGMDMFVEKGEGNTRYLIIKTDNEDQEFLRYCIMRYYKKCTEKIAQKSLDYYTRKLDLSFNSFRVTGQNERTGRSRFPHSGFASKNIDISNQITIWGSSSRKKNLKFDWKLLMLPEEVVDYVIVHELSHLKKMNHSGAFWREVEKMMPEYKECRNWLSNHGKEYEIF